MMAALPSLNNLPEAPSETGEINSFRAALEDDNQPASSYCLPVAGASRDIFSDIDDHISSPSWGMHLKKVSKLLPYPGVCSCRFYRFKAEM